MGEGVDLRDPGYRYVFVLTSGETLTVEKRDAKRVVDKRTAMSDPETLWELTVNGVVRRVWMDEITDWRQEER